MSYTKRLYHDDISGEQYYDDDLGYMLEELFHTDSIDSSQDYLKYMTILHEAGFSKEDSLSILTPLTSEDQILN